MLNEMKKLFVIVSFTGNYVQITIFVKAINKAVFICDFPAPIAR